MTSEEGHTTAREHIHVPRAVLLMGTPRPTAVPPPTQWIHSSWVGGGKEPRAGDIHRTGVRFCFYVYSGPEWMMSPPAAVESGAMNHP